MKSIWLVLAGAWLAFGSAAAGASCAPREEAVVQAARAEEDAGPPPPVCTREVCAQRPGRLVCEDGWRGHGCGKYRIEYEHHCECVAWAPAPQDGGAP